MSGPVRTITRVIAKAGCEDAIKSLLQSLLYPTREEPGCLRYELWRGHNGREFVTVGEWKDEAAVVTHLRSFYVDEFIGELVECIEHPPDMQMYTPLDD